MQFYLHEPGFTSPVPATRLSDGTIRFIAILATLLSPLFPAEVPNYAFNGFKNAVRNGVAGIIVLLVDVEGSVKTSAREHLKFRDGWDLSFAADDKVHLMVQTMETRIVADPGALAEYFGQHKRASITRSAMPAIF